jgi:hypothetical protein
MFEAYFSIIVSLFIIEVLLSVDNALVSASFNPVSVSNWFILALLLALALHSTQNNDFAKFSYYKITGYFFSIAFY